MTLAVVIIVHCSTNPVIVTIFLCEVLLSILYTCSLFSVLFPIVKAPIVHRFYIDF